MQSPAEKKPGVYTYVSQWPIYSLAWSARHDKPSRLAIGSFIEDYSNKVELVQFNSSTSDFTTDNRLIFDHPYAPTNLMFFPSDAATNPDLIATSGDYLRIWEIHDDRIELKSLLNGNMSSEFNSAITSFDWAEFDTRRVATSSVDTTCTIWDIEREAVDTQLVAHDKEVYDISWGGFNVFASASGDGTVRVFDLRDKERSTIVYENPAQDGSLLRLEWNKHDPRFIATVGVDSNKVVILDIRFPTAPMMELKKHGASVNAVSWSPRMGHQLCSVSDDSRAMIWEVVRTGFGSDGADVEPEMWYGATAQINQVRWSPVELDWIAIAFMNKLQLLKV
ncbi:PREDICTED: WD repeat-containing protein LWD1-like [Fragaria vesca subsp. vesca]|uniref:WD repeat-containing protein LWD1-like n=1 Tax=Fragaria vesca subsp. vesca TaxID=101020 RepID=UPI0002C35102|nr:PREDICTED: WD repeat-containing protein LWD1-like [Fragaria vesca subsp. vesca]USN17646.1 LWD1-like transcription factor [Fragaria x ananassa]